MWPWWVMIPTEVEENDEDEEDDEDEGDEKDEDEIQSSWNS